MVPTLFAAFMAATVLIIVPPGPSVALASAQAVRFGPRAAMVTVAGDALGSAVHVVVAVASLQVLIGLSEVLLPWLQIAGGMFILYLAARSFMATPGTTAPAAHRASFLAGFFACVTNPKAIVFFAALFPGFLSPDHNVILQSLIYGLVFIVLDAALILGYSMLAMRAFQRVTSPRISIERLSGLGLLGVGLLLIGKGYRALPSN